MKKASKIMFLIGGILAIVGAVVFLALGLVFVITSGLAHSTDVPAWVAEFFTKLAAENKISVKEAIDLVTAIGVVFMVFFAFSIPAAVLSFICKGKEYRPLPLLIVATAVSLVAACEISVVGGILGIVNWAKNERKEIAK